MDTAQKNKSIPGPALDHELPKPPEPPEISPPRTPPEITAIPVLAPPVSVSVIASVPPPKKFPFMIVTLILFIIIAGFAGFYLFFQNQVKPPIRPVQLLITPPVTIPPASPTTPANPFATPSSVLINPFVSPTTAYENPFGASSQNPFSGATLSATPNNQPYENPFERP